MRPCSRAMRPPPNPISCFMATAFPQCAYLKASNVKVDLVYIDPPFASGANYAKKIVLRNGSGGKNGGAAIEGSDNAIGEEVMYGDIWQKEDYLNWLYERLLAMRQVLSDTGSIYVHLDWHIGPYVKILIDKVFGEENFLNEIIWQRFNFHADANKFGIVHEAFSSMDAAKIIFSTNSMRRSSNPISTVTSPDAIRTGEFFAWTIRLRQRTGARAKR